MKMLMAMDQPRDLLTAVEREGDAAFMTCLRESSRLDPMVLYRECTPREPAGRIACVRMAAGG
jgi:hypothetical protein